MIVYPAAFVASAVHPLTHARIAWHDLARELALDGNDVTVSSETVAGPRDAPLRPDTAEFWQAAGLPATWDLDLGSLQSIDYVGLAGHTIGSSGATVSCKVSTDGDFAAHALLPGTTSNYVKTPDAAALDITGDIDLRARAALIAKRQATGQVSWEFRVDATTGNLSFAWSADGTAVSVMTSDAAVGASDGTALWVRVTFDVDDGAGNKSARFYTSTDGVTWNQIGTTQTTAGTTSLFSSTSELSLGAIEAGATAPLNGKLYYAEVRSGIGGSVVAEFDPENDATHGATSFVSGGGETWTVNQSGSPAAAIVHHRLGGEVMPGDDAPILFLDTARSAQYVRIGLTGSTVPRIAVIRAGVALAMTRPIYAGVTPILFQRRTVKKASVSRGGQFLGQSIRRHGITGSVSFRHLQAAWMRTTFDQFVRSARSYPYFIAWRPQTFPNEVGYVWTEDDIRPDNMGTRDLMQVSWSYEGIGHD